jgi:hypothetical protein
MQQQPSGLIYLVALLVLLPLLYLRLRRMMKPQALKLKQLWVRPAILIALGVFVVFWPVPGRAPLGPSDYVWLALAGVLGGAAGWQWGRTTKLHMHPENGTVMQTGSMAGMMVFLFLVLMRTGLRAGLGAQAAAWHINMLLVADVSIVFSALLFAVRGLEIFLRARAIMAQAVPAAFE